MSSGGDKKEEVVKHTIQVSVDHIKRAIKEYTGREASDSEVRKIKREVKSNLEMLEENFFNEYGVELAVQNYFDSTDWDKDKNE